MTLIIKLCELVKTLCREVRTLQEIAIFLCKIQHVNLVSVNVRCNRKVYTVASCPNPVVTVESFSVTNAVLVKVGL